MIFSKLQGLFNLLFTLRFHQLSKTNFMKCKTKTEYSTCCQLNMKKLNIITSQCVNLPYMRQAVMETFFINNFVPGRFQYKRYIILYLDVFKIDFSLSPLW